MAYIVKGVVPQPRQMVNYFLHHESTDPKLPKEGRANGEAGHEISVTTESKTVAKNLAKAMSGALIDVTITQDGKSIEIDTTRCYFCGDRFPLEKGTKPEDGMYKCEVGEFWSEKLQDSVLAHPDCLPNGIEAVLSNDDPEWKMA